MSRAEKRILIVDDEPHQVETVCRGLFLCGYECRGVTGVPEALALLNDGYRADLVLTDLTMPEQSGIALIKATRAQFPGLPILVMTGLAETDDTARVTALGIPMLQKPFDPETLAHAIETVLARAHNGGNG